MFKKQKNSLLLFLIPVLIVIFYGLTHLYKLTFLPVFADESIYIRWSQLIIDDWQQYLFFPLNDGKTPLQMWLMIPLLKIFSDPLFAARFLSVLAGLGQMFVMAKIVKELGGRKLAQYLTMFLVAVLPFWYFHHRMALIDGLFTLFLSLCFLYLVKLTLSAQRIKMSKIEKIQQFLSKKGLIKAIRHPEFCSNCTLVAGVFFGLALWTKLSALLFIPIFFMVSLIAKNLDINKWSILLAKLSVSFLIGLSLFLILKIHPAFAQLFTRGNDFLYGVNEVFIEGLDKILIRNFFNFISYLTAYLTWPVLILPFVGMLIGKSRRTILVLLLSTLIFLSPIILLGKVVYPRYLMPVVIFLTIALSLSMQDIYLCFREKCKTMNYLWKIIVLILMIYPSFKFIYFANTNLAQIPFVAIDQEQYLYEWSAGFGVKEAVDLIRKEARDKKVIVATEGYFGTLPDGILMYLHNTNVDNIFVEGIGQPVGKIPDEFLQKAQDFDKILLIVNSHRMKMDLNQEDLLIEYCRPNGAPCQQVWEIKN